MTAYRGTDQAVRGGRHGQKLHSGVPPPPQGRGMPAAVRMPAVVRTPACHSRRFKGERPIGTATGQQSQPPRPCAKPPHPRRAVLGDASAHTIEGHGGEGCRKGIIPRGIGRGPLIVYPSGPSLISPPPPSESCSPRPLGDVLSCPPPPHGGCRPGALYFVVGRGGQSNDPGNNQHNPQYANYWAPLTRKRHTPRHIQHSPNTPTTGLRERGNDTSRSTGRSGRQNAATRRSMRREERVTVQGPVKEQQPDGMSHRGGGARAIDQTGQAVFLRSLQPRPPPPPRRPRSAFLPTPRALPPRNRALPLCTGQPRPSTDCPPPPPSQRPRRGRGRLGVRGSLHDKSADTSRPLRDGLPGAE